MGTRCITTVRSQWNDDTPQRQHATVYRHWDGYLEGHGAWLADFLSGRVIVNGVSGDTPLRHANGPGWLAAQLVAELQADNHDPDLVEHGAIMGQEFSYDIYVRGFGTACPTVCVTVFDGPMTLFGDGGEKCDHRIFSGTVEEFGAFIATRAGADDEPAT